MANEEKQSRVSSLSPEVKAQAVEAARPAASLMDRATAHQQDASDPGSNRTGGKEALMHTQGTPGKAQEALSPTDAHKGQTRSQQRSMERGRSPDR